MGLNTTSFPWLGHVVRAQNPISKVIIAQQAVWRSAQIPPQAMVYSILTGTKYGSLPLLTK